MRKLLGGIMALVACLAAFLAWQDGRFAHLRVTDPAAAYAERPDDALALGNALDRKMQRRADATISDRELGVVRSAIAKRPLARVLLRALGTKAEAEGNAARTDAAMNLSDHVSRRDSLTQLWLIERSVAKDDMQSAVAHYHAALSVNPDLGSVLFPILTKAIGFPEVRKAIEPYIARRAPWAIGMLNNAITNGDPQNVALLILPVGGHARGDAYDAINGRLITRLAETGNLDLAHRLAQAVFTKVDPKGLSLLAVSDATTDKQLGALAWMFSEDGRILASANGAGGFDLDVDPLINGVAASRILAVTGGRTYDFNFMARSGSDVAAELTWVGFCLSPKSKTLVLNQKLAWPREARRQQFEIVAPKDCSGLQLILTSRGPEGQRPAHVVFENFRLDSARN